jgi:hypothetical protein
MPYQQQRNSQVLVNHNKKNTTASVSGENETSSSNDEPTNEHFFSYIDNNK